MTEVVDEIFEAFRAKGTAMYVGEPVTVREHMLQAAAAAEAEGATDELVAAALLHDIGHLLTDEPEDAAEHGVDTAHEELGYEFLEQSFPSSIVEPVRLHVAAKRYLVATEPDYAAELSPASLLSLSLQGGPMSAEEIAGFQSLPYWREACRLRRWDDLAKDPDSATSPLEHYRTVLEAVVLSAA